MSEIIREHFKEEINPEKERPEYNFELMKEIEPAMISLVQQMKDNIEKGEYTALLSDEVGGRIPTLILRKIIKEKGPNKDFKTYFLSAGQNMPGWEFPDEEDFMSPRDYSEPRISDKKGYKKMRGYLADLDYGNGRLLIVTEYTFKGKTLQKIGLALEDTGIIGGFDFAIMHNTGFSDVIERLEKFECKNGSKIFVGEENYNSQFSEGHKELGGIRKAKEYSPVPIKTLKKIKEEGIREITKEEREKILGIGEEVSLDKRFDNLNDPKRAAEYARRKKEPLTSEEEKDIQRKITLAREDVDTMAKRVIEQVWK